MHRRFLASTALALLAAPAGAEQLLLGGRSEAFWTDNQTGTAQDIAAGGAVRLAPWVDVSDAEGRVTWGLRYAPTYNYYFDQSSLSGFDQDVGGRFAWHLGDRTTFTASDRFTQYQSVTSFNEQAAPGQDIIPVNQNQLFSLNNASGSLHHQLGPLDQVSLSLSQSLYDYSEENQPDHSFLGANLAYDHTLSERTSVGTRLSWGRQTTDFLNVPDGVTDYYSLSGSLTYAISRTSQLSLSAGPAMIVGNSNDFVAPSVQAAPGVTIENAAVRSWFPLREESDGFHFLDADTCPLKSGARIQSPTCKTVSQALDANQLRVLNEIRDPSNGILGNNRVLIPFLGSVPSIGGSNTTYFASATLSKQWERWDGTLSYTRSAGQSTTIATVSDIVFGSLDWKIARLWTADFSGSYELREQANQNFALVAELSNQQIPLGAFPSGATSTGVRFAEVAGGVAVELLTLDLRVAYQLASHASLYLTTEYTQQSGTGDAGALTSPSRLALYIGFNYSFDPVNF